MRPPGLRAIGAPQGCSSIGRAAVSKTAGCRFKSCHPCHRTADNGPTAPRRSGPPPRGERGAVSDEKPGREDGAALSGPDAVSDAELTDEQLDREAPGVDDASELEAAEAELAAEAEADEDKVVGTPARRRGGRITAGGDEAGTAAGAGVGSPRATTRPGPPPRGGAVPPERPPDRLPVRGAPAPAPPRSAPAPRPSARGGRW